MLPSSKSFTDTPQTQINPEGEQFLIFPDSCKITSLDLIKNSESNFKMILISPKKGSTFWSTIRKVPLVSQKTKTFSARPRTKTEDDICYWSKRIAKREKKLANLDSKLKKVKLKNTNIKKERDSLVDTIIDAEFKINQLDRFTAFNKMKGEQIMDKLIIVGKQKEDCETRLKVVEKNKI